MPNNKAEQRDQLIMEFGVLIQPFEELMKTELPPDSKGYRKAIAKVQAGDGAWRLTVKDFTTFADDLWMAREFQKISHVNERFCSEVSDMLPDRDNEIDFALLREAICQVFVQYKDNFRKLLSHVPVDWEPEIFEANTPFTAYLKIKSSLTLVTQRVHYFDRYLKEEFFFLFLKHIGRDISVRVITTPGKNDYGVENVKHISDLARQEYADYQLIEVAPKKFHDRNLRVDEQIFSLGPGVGQAGIALTNFGPADSSAKAHEELDKIIQSGTIIHRS